MTVVLDCLCDDNAIGPRPIKPSHPSREESMVFEVVDYSAIRQKQNLSYPSSLSLTGRWRVDASRDPELDATASPPLWADLSFLQQQSGKPAARVLVPSTA